MNINLTLIGQAISFAIFVWFCMKYVWPPITSALEQRKKTIAEGLSAAELGQQSLEKAKAATVLLEKNLNKKGLLYTIMNLIHNDQKLLEMQNASALIGKPNATNKIVDNVFNILP